MPVYRFSKAFDITRGAKAFLNLEGGLTRGALLDVEQYNEQAEDPRNARVHFREQEGALGAKNQRLDRPREELRVSQKGRRR